MEGFGAQPASQAPGPKPDSSPSLSCMTLDKLLPSLCLSFSIRETEILAGPLPGLSC